MTKEISKSLVCILMRQDIEIWIEKERFNPIYEKLQQQTKFLSIDDQIVNTADIVGIFNPQTIEEKTRRKNGEWKCKYGTWHERNQKCECIDENIKKQREEFYKENGYYEL